ncbi:MAG: 1,4-alpha-glucan branching enzyme, partial [Gammaproteobacteria bacterium]
MSPILPPNKLSLGHDLEKLIKAQYHDPFSVLGHCDGYSGKVIRVMIPFCKSVRLGKKGPEMVRLPNTDIFEYPYSKEDIPDHYRLDWEDNEGNQYTEYDPYTFMPNISDYDLYLFNQGRHWHIYRILGAHCIEIDGIQGVQFAVWAPNAERVSIIADFNRWDGRRHPMQSIGSSGVWVLFIPEVATEIPYKFEIRNRESGQILVKSDPYAQQFEIRPNTASLVTKPSKFCWLDEHWVASRKETDWLHEPMSIYEVHLGSWQR